MKLKNTSSKEIPEDWEVLEVKNIIEELVMGQAPCSTSYNTNGIGVPFVKATEFDEVYPRIEVWTTSPIKEVDENFLLISIAGTIGLVNKGIRCAIGRSVAGIKPDLTKIDFDYLYYFLKLNSKKLIGRGSSQKIIIARDIEQIKVIKPKSLQEQKAIAQILSTVDKAIQKVDEIIAKTERLKKGLMQELLTKGIGHKEFKDTEIGRIPKEWEVVKVEKLFDLYKGTTPSTKVKEYWNGVIPFVTPTDVTRISDLNERYLESTENYITEEGLKSKRLKIVPRNSLLFTSRATIGYLAINKTEVVINQGIISLIPKDVNIDVIFFYYSLQKLKNLFESLAGGSTYKEISVSTLSNVSVPLPSFSEQQKIAEILASIDKKLERIKKGLMNDLLTGKKRVKL